VTAFSFAQSLTSSPSVSSASAQAACTSCLLEAFNPATLTYPGPVLGNQTITVAVVFATPYTDVEGRTVSIDYSTSFKTEVETPVANNATDLFSATWTALGQIL
jgi:hypothetical protein